MQNSNNLLKYQPSRTICTDRFYTEKLCLNKKTGKPVLIRRYNKKQVLTNSLTSNLELQVKLMSKFDCRHWLKPVEYFQNSTYAYEVFSCDLQAVSLEDLLNVELSDREIRFLTAQLVCAIDSLHREGYYHSNIHPKSFVLCEDGILKMTNMFYAKKIENSKKKERSEGAAPLDKHIFMAPEVFDSSTDESLTVDFWALGAIIYQFYHDREHCCLSELTTPCKVWTLIEYNQSKVPKDAIDLMKKLLRKSQQRLGKHCITELKRHPFFANIDWTFSNAKQILPQSDIAFCHGKKGTIWREMYFYELQAPNPRDNVYFHGFNFLPAGNYVVWNEKKEQKWKCPTEWTPSNPKLKQIWDKIEQEKDFQKEKTPPES